LLLLRPLEVGALLSLDAILYRLVGDDLEVVAFLHGARDLPTALANRIARDLE
jgi:hypothetical protein